MGQGAEDADCAEDAREGREQFEAAKAYASAMRERNRMREGYDKNKAASIGTTIRCCVCNKKFVKKVASQAFCSAKAKCRHVFHNTKNEERLARSYDWM